MNYDAGLQIAVAVWDGRVPDVHSAFTILSIRRCHEIGIVEPRTVLRVSDDSVVLPASTSKVVLLEISRNFIKSIAEMKESVGCWMAWTAD
jgi:hypothetical protein